MRHAEAASFSDLIRNAAVHWPAQRPWSSHCWHWEEAKSFPRKEQLYHTVVAVSFLPYMSKCCSLHTPVWWKSSCGKFEWLLLVELPICFKTVYKCDLFFLYFCFDWARKNSFRCLNENDRFLFVYILRQIKVALCISLI